MLTAKQHSYWRQFDYVFSFDEGPLTEKFGRLVFNGKKHLAYSRKNPWNALLKLIVDLRLPSRTEDRAFYVDLNYLLKDGVPQIIESPHMPATLMGIARFGLFAVRAMAQSYLWSFRALDYDKRSAAPIFPEPVRLADQTIVNPKVYPIYDIDLDKPPHESKKYPCTEKPYIRLSKYAKTSSGEQKHILLIHGLAHGGAIFATSTIEKPMTAYFLEQGYTVWVLDHRLSPALEWYPNRRKVTMDHLAETDVRLAVEYVYREAGCKIDVFAHCVGAGAFAMAVLSGKLHDGKKSKIAKATIHGVTPWLVASPKNRANGKLAAFYKDVLRFSDPGEEGFDPIPPYQPQGSDPDFWEALIDRMASGVPKPASEVNGHNEGSFGKAVCNRMALWYGEQWNHQNVDAKTHRRIDELFGFGNLEVFKQIYFCILRERLTDREGVNVYLTEKNIENYWLFDTMFIHGDDNQVFSVASARESSWKLNETTRVIKDVSTNKDYTKPTIWKFELSRYGHLDMILGKGAVTHVYPIIHDFFSEKLESKYLKFPDEVTATIDKDPKRRTHKGLPPKSPSIGPAIHSPACQNDKVSVQVWLEPTTTSTSPAKYLSYDYHLDARQFSGYVMTSKSLQGKYGVYWQHKYVGKPRKKEPIFASVIYAQEKTPQAGAPTAKNDGPCTYSGGDSHYAWLNKMFLEPEKRSLSFAAGSCRYPGSPFEREASDAVFSAILTQAKDARGESSDALDFALFLGDQIYADATADVFDTHEVAERYWQRYRDAFKSKHMKALLNYLPSYFAVDDHEFEDDWLGHETYCPAIHPKSDVYLQARDAARSYLGRTGHLKDHRFWYSFSALNQSFFVMDTRTERNIRRADIPPEKALLTDPDQSDQWSELTGWLNKRVKNAPLFIASGSPLAPPSSEVLRHKESWRTNDGWLGFPGTLSQFVDFVTKNQIENIVMLGGDLHLSAYAKMIFKGNGREVAIHQIVASGLYAPMPFGNTKIRELGSGTYKIPASNHTIEFGEPHILATAPTHFLRVDLAPTNLITVCAFDHHNKDLGKVSFQLR